MLELLKRTRKIAGPVTAVMGLATVAVVMPAAAETISYGTHSPPNHGIMAEGFLPFAKAVEEDTKGEVTFELLAGGAVVSAKTALSGIGSGLVGSGYVIDAYVPQVLPHSTLISDLGPFNASALAATAAATETQLLDCPGCVGDLEKAGAVTLGVNAIAPYKLMCKEPVTSVEGLKGRKVRTASVWGRIMAEIGMVPVNIPVTDIYEAMERGTLDCVLGPEGWLKAYNLWDSAKYVVDQPLGAWAGGHAMTINKDRWESLSPAGRDAILDHVPAMLLAMTESYENEAAVAREEAKARNLTFQPALPELETAMEKARQSLLGEVIERAKGRGIDAARQIAGRYIVVKAKWDKIVANSNGDLAVLEKALKTEVYDKLPR